MRCYWRSDLRKIRREGVKRGGPRNGWAQQCGIEVRQIDGGEGNNSWERVSVSAMMAVMRAGFCCWRRDSAIIILWILTSIQYYCSVLNSFRPKKDSSIGTKAYGSWREACSQRSRRGFVVSQDKSIQPRKSGVFWSAPASDGRGMLSDSMTVWWMGRGQHKGRAMFEQRLQDPLC